MGYLYSSVAGIILPYFDVVSLPRYARVNTLVTSSTDAKEELATQGFQIATGKEVSELESNEFLLDQHIPNLLIFPHSTDLHDNSMYTDGKLILQDKASCLPAFVLNPPPHSVVIDACAAPGNKTSHLAAIMENKGVIYAFDLDSSRITILRRQLSRAQADAVEIHEGDFLEVTPSEDYFDGRPIDYILLDPSCSGSGMASRLEELIEGDEDKQVHMKRLAALASFQTKMLKHAMSFPTVKRIVYSTCSIHKEENEHVVASALEDHKDSFQLVNVMPEWCHRGLTSSFSEGFKCLRASAQQDQTNGFFVALFERKEGELLLPGVDCETSDQSETQRVSASSAKKRKDRIEGAAKTDYSSQRIAKKRKKKSKTKQPVTAAK